MGVEQVNRAQVRKHRFWVFLLVLFSRMSRCREIMGVRKAGFGEESVDGERESGSGAVDWSTQVQREVEKRSKGGLEYFSSSKSHDGFFKPMNFVIGKRSSKPPLERELGMFFLGEIARSLITIRIVPILRRLQNRRRIVGRGIRFFLFLR